MIRFLRVIVYSLTTLLAVIVSTGAAQQSIGTLSPASIGWPTYTLHGEPLVVPVTVTNDGDAPLNATVSTLQLEGFGTWLAVDQASLAIPALDQATLNVTINNGGVVNNPGTIVAWDGWVLFAIDPPTATDSLGLFVQMIVADTIVLPQWDTLATSCLSLTVGSNANMGNQGVGGANMNFAADCDDSDTIPGDASVYLYDASPVVFKGGQAGTWSMYTHQNAWYPIEGGWTYSSTGSCDFDNYTASVSGPSVSSDSSLVMECVTYAPTHPDSCNFVIHRMSLTSLWGTAQNDLTVGLLLDWNVPSDSLVNNSFGLDFFSGAYWQQGQELNDPAGDAVECQDNDARFGGFGLIGYADQNGEVLTHVLGLPGRAAEVPMLSGGDGDLDPAQVYSLLTSPTGPILGPPADLMTSATVFSSYNLAAGDTLVVWSVLAAVENGSSADLIAAVTKGRAWFAQNRPLPAQCDETCCNLMGDVNLDGQLNLTDLTCLVERIFVDPSTLCVPMLADMPMPMVTLSVVSR